MPKTLSVSNKLISLRGRILLSDAAGEPVYEARGEFALFSPTWRLQRGTSQLASIRRKLFAWAPTWIIQYGDATFRIRRKLLAFTRQYYTVGGPYDGVRISGNLWDLRFRIEHKQRLIARAAGRILTLRDRHDVEIAGKSEQDELFTALAMIVLHLDRKAESAASRQNDD